MKLIDVVFVPLTWFDLLDIFLVAILIYKVHTLFRKSIVLQGFLIMLALFISRRAAEVLNMRLIASALEEFLEIGIIVLVVIFAPELRRFLLSFRQTSWFSRLQTAASRNMSSTLNLKALKRAIEKLADSRTGALIVLQKDDKLESIIESGDYIGAEITEALLMSIFNTKSPLHDGAVVIKDDKILAARCVLPVSDDPDIPGELGLRHRSGLGVTELTDAAAIIVSEETGKVSRAENGVLKRNLNPEELDKFLDNFYGKVPT